MRQAWLLWIVGCGGPSPGTGPDGTADEADADTDADSDADADADSDADTDTTTTSGAPSISGSCALQPDNALRVDCDLTVVPDGPLTITFTPTGGGAARTTSVTDPARDHHVTLWRMHAATTYDWTATAVDTGLTLTGTFTTGTLPSGADVEIDQTTLGASPAPDDVMFLIECDTPHAVVVDADGSVVWYQDLAAGLAGRHDGLGMSFSDGGVTAVLDRTRVRRFALDGTVLLDVERGVTPGFDKLVHHDAYSRDGLTYVLNAEEYTFDGDDYVLDGVYVFDAAGTLLAEWEIADQVTPDDPNVAVNGYWGIPFPGASDWSHGNSLYVDEALDLYVSLFELDTIVKLVGDPADPAFGERRWVLDGSGSAPWPADFVITDPNDLTPDHTFSHQHHPNPLPSGTFLLFDNEEGFAISRVLELALDEAAGEAEIVGSYSIGQACPIEGGAFELSNGNLLATCTTRGTFYEIDRATGGIVRTITPDCGFFGSAGLIPRAIPVAL